MRRDRVRDRGVATPTIDEGAGRGSRIAVERSGPNTCKVEVMIKRYGMEVMIGYWGLSGPIPRCRLASWNRAQGVRILHVEVINLWKGSALDGSTRLVLYYVCTILSCL